MAQCDAELCLLYKTCFQVYGTGESKPPCAQAAEALKPSHNSASKPCPECGCVVGHMGGCRILANHGASL